MLTRNIRTVIEICAPTLGVQCAGCWMLTVDGLGKKTPRTAVGLDILLKVSIPVYRKLRKHRVIHIERVLPSIPLASLCVF